MTYSPQAAASALNPGRTIGQQLAIAIARRDEVPADQKAEIVSVLARVGLSRRDLQFQRGYYLFSHG